MTGYQYNEKWGAIHFLVFTLAINLVFLPMHALGVAGMARRIPDYSDGFLNWTRIMTIGTFATLISLPLPAKALLSCQMMPHPFHLVDYSPWPSFIR